MFSHNGKLFPVFAAVEAFGKEGEGVKEKEEELKKRYQQPEIGFVEPHHCAFIDKCTG